MDFRKMICPSCGENMGGAGGQFGGRVTVAKFKCECGTALMVIPMTKEYEYSVSATTDEDRRDRSKKYDDFEREIDVVVTDLQREVNFQTKPDPKIVEGTHRKDKGAVQIAQNTITMAKKRVKGHAANSKLNGEWAKHVKSDGKKETSGKRRMQDKEIIREETKYKGDDSSIWEVRRGLDKATNSPESMKAHSDAFYNNERIYD